MYKVVKRDCPMFGIGPYVCEFICDTASDVSTLPTSTSEGTGGKTAYDNQMCASGSIAIVAENGSESKQYMLNNQDIWCPYSVAAGSSGGGSSGSSITVDFALSNTSENPVANKVIVAALDDKANVDDIPNIKVNEAVNADTLGGIQAVDFRQITSIKINTLPTPPSSEGDYFVSQSDSSFPYLYGNLSIRYGSYTGEFVAIYQTTGDDQNIWFNVYRGGWTGWRRINDGGNADTLDGMHADSFAKANSPSIEGEIRLLREGNATINGSIFIWEDTLRLRNQDPNAENTTYTDLIVTPFGIFTEGYGIARQQIYGGRPYITGSFSGTSLTTDSFDFQPSFAICNDDKTIKYGEIVHLPTQVSISYKVLFQNLSDTTHQYIIFK